MKVPIRKTISGTEYWDTRKKRTLFVPAGKNPHFDVTENPESMIGSKNLKVTIDGTEAASKVREVIDEAKKELQEKESKGNGDAPVVSDLNELTVPQLRKYAANSGIEIPADVKKKGDIIKLLSDEQ